MSTDELHQQVELLNARAAAQKRILRALEHSDLANAKSEHEKNTIREIYADTAQNLNHATAEKKIKLAREAFGQVQDDEAGAMTRRTTLEHARHFALREFGAADSRVREYDRQIATLNASIGDLEAEKEKLAGDIEKQTSANAARNQADVNQDIAAGDVAQSAKGIAEMVSAGQTVETGQQAFMTEFADEMAHRTGQLNGGQNFTNAKAAATFIENFFKTQTDPYNVLFAQIHSAMLAAKAGQDALASLWLNKFATLEAQVKAGTTLCHT